MDTMKAFAMGAANRDKPQMVFDWCKATRLIVESGAKSASAGLAVGRSSDPQRANLCVPGFDLGDS